jgi:CO/xanthine dehydrogenase FAD-binding subunit
MKPAPFEYARPASVDEACALLAADDGARLIAGGQTLVPLMAMRLARPSRLIDIARIRELAFVRDEGAAIAIGAATRQCLVERDPLVREKLPLLARVMPMVGHAATRARGTIGGSLANGDPAAEIVLVAATLGATLTWRENGRDNETAAADFFLGPMVTCLPPAACLTAVRFPVWPERRIGTGFHEVNARQSDFAFVSAAAQMALDDDGRCLRAAVGIGAAPAAPLRLAAVENALVGTRGEQALLRPVLIEALAGVEMFTDLHASADYRRRAAVTLALRAIADAWRDAEAGGGHAR